MRLLAAAGLVALLASGCSSLTFPGRSTELQDGKNYWFDYDASRRGTLLLHAKDSAGKSTFRSCAEPAPDMAISLASKIEGELKYADLDTKARAEFATQAIKLADKSQMILFIREALYRLCELNLNGNLQQAEITGIYGKIVDIALRLGSEKALEIDIMTARVQIASAEAAIAKINGEQIRLVEAEKKLGATIKEKEQAVQELKTKGEQDSEKLKQLEKDLLDARTRLAKAEQDKELLAVQRKREEEKREHGIQAVKQTTMEADATIKMLTGTKGAGEQLLKAKEAPLAPAVVGVADTK